MRTRASFVVSLALALAAGGGGACGGDGIDIAVRIPEGGDDPLSKIDALVLSAEDADDMVVTTGRFAAGSTRLFLDEIPYGESMSLTLEGVNEIMGTDSIVHSAGRSCATDFLPGALSAEPVPMYFAVALRFSPVSEAVAVPETARRAEDGLGITLAPGLVMVLGGAPQGGAPVSDAVLYDHIAGTLAAEAIPASAARAGAAAAPLSGGSWMVAGGAGSGSPIDSSILVEADGRVTDLPILMTNARAGHTLSALADGRVVAIGGHDGAATVAEAEACSGPACLGSPGAFAVAGTLASARWGHSATPLTLASNTTIYVIGGNRAPPGAPVDLAGIGAEKFNPLAPAATAFVALDGAPVEGRSLHTATVLPDSSILLAGGIGESGSATASAEVFDPFSESFVGVEALPVPREGHTATLLANGQVLIAGGRDETGTPLATAELYDPPTRTFLATGGMRVARAGHAAIRLCDGTVFLAGGAANAPYAEIYTPLPR